MNNTGDLRALATGVPRQGTFLRSLQTSNSRNGSSGAPFVGLFLMFIALCIGVLIFRVCKPGDQLPQRATLSTTNNGVSDQQPQEQQQRHVNAQLGISKALHREKVEKQLVTRPYTKDEGDSQNDCAICLSSLRHGDMVAQSVNLECTHRFHSDCIVDWLVKHPACPECRRDFLKPTC